jgi:hypothetical protein
VGGHLPAHIVTSTPRSESAMQLTPDFQRKSPQSE